MSITKKRSNSDDDFLNVGLDATATFDNSRSNPTEYASSENLDAIDAEEDEFEDEDLDEEEEYDDEDDEDEEYEDDDEDDEDENEDGHDPARGSKAPSVYRKI